MATPERENLISGRALKQRKHKAHQETKKLEQLQMKRLTTMLMALSAMPAIMATPTERALAASFVELYDVEHGCMFTKNLPQERLQEFCS